MSDQTITPRLKFEDDIIASEMDDQLKKNALDYIAYMQANGLTPETPGSNHFEFAGEYVCQIVFFSEGNIPGWTIFMGGYDDILHRSEYQNYPIEAQLREFAWAHVSPCGSCGCGTEPGKRVMLFGREFTNLCTATWSIRNPHGEALELTKRLTNYWAKTRVDLAKNYKPYVPGSNEWLSANGFGAHAGRPLEKAYTKSLDARFYVTPRRRYVSDAAFGFSGNGWVPAKPEQIPVALHIGGHSARFRANKEPTSGWAAVETLKYQVNVTYYAEMSVNITAGTYSVMLWILDANGDIDTPYCIAKNYPFRLGGNSAVSAITAIDTMYLGSGSGGAAVVIRDFKVVSGE